MPLSADIHRHLLDHVRHPQDENHKPGDASRNGHLVTLGPISIPRIPSSREQKTPFHCCSLSASSVFVSDLCRSGRSQGPSG